MAQNSYSGLMLKKIPYSETSLIIKCLTEKEGIKTFLFQGALRKGKNANILQPLAWVELESFARSDSAMQKVKSVNLIAQRKNISFDTYRSSIVMFITDVLIHIIPEDDPQETLYYLLLDVLTAIDAKSFAAEAHIYFLIALTQIMGVEPQLNHGMKVKYFDLLNGEFIDQLPPHQTVLYEDDTQAFFQAFMMKAPEAINFSNGIERNAVIQNLIKYLNIHFDYFKTPSSLEVLQTMFD